ncbi:hypothetical protein GUJ16_13465 [Enterococcus hirae]|nr:hypothetical protein [Enterococcus hirae]
MAHAAARFLLPDLAAVTAILAAHAGHCQHAARVLDVDEATLLARLDAAHLTPAEVARVTAWLEAA